MALRRGLELPRGIAVAVAAAALVPLAQLALATTTGLRWDLRVSALQLVALPLFGRLQSVFAAGEELGWRGWLHTQLRQRWGVLALGAFTGAIWALWHVPVAVDLYLDGELPARMAITCVLDIAPWALLLAALREVHRSVWPAIIGHGALNSVRVWVLRNFTTPEAELTDLQFWSLHAIGWALWVVAAVAVLRVWAPARRTELSVA